MTFFKCISCYLYILNKEYAVAKPWHKNVHLETHAVNL